MGRLLFGISLGFGLVVVLVLSEVSKIYGLADNVTYRLRLALGQCAASAGPVVFLTANSTWTVAGLLTPACLRPSAEELEAEFTFAIVGEDGKQHSVRATSAHEASAGLFVATLPADAFDGRAVTVHVAMRTAHPGIGCAPRAFRLPAVTGGEGDRLRVALMGDNQNGAPAFRALMQDVAEADGSSGGGRGGEWDLLVHTGDSTQNDRDEREAVILFLAPLEHFYARLQAQRRRRLSSGEDAEAVGVPPVLLARGNHDALWVLAYNGRLQSQQAPSPSSSSSVAAAEPSAYFVADTGPIRWIVLDAISPAVAEQAAWLRGVCDARAAEAAGETCRRSWTVVVVHIPPYIEYWDPVPWFNQSESEWGAHVRKTLLPILTADDGGCAPDVVVGGHSHIYQRGSGGGVPLLAIIGGAGGGLEDPQKWHVKNWGFYAVTAAQHHFAALETPPAPPANDARGPAATCRQPLSWTAHALGGGALDHVTLPPPVST